MSTGLYTLRKTYVDGDVLSASDYVADHQQHIDNQNPQETGAYSDNVSQMQTVTSPGDVGTESLAASLADEIARLRYVLKDIKGKLNGAAVAQWYSTAYNVNGAGRFQTANVNTNLSIFSTPVTIVTFPAITTRGGLVRVDFQAMFSTALTSTAAFVLVSLRRGGVGVASATTQVQGNPAGGSVFSPIALPPLFDHPGAGSYVYDVQVATTSSVFVTPPSGSAYVTELLVA